VTLNDGRPQPGPSGATASGAAADAGPPERRSVASELLAELTAWGPRDRLWAFRGWHQQSLSLIQLQVLTLLEAEGPQAMSRIAEGLDVSVASATGIVDRMEEHGLAARRHDAADRRRILVDATERGRGVFHGLEAERRLRLARLLGELTEEERAGFLMGLRALRAARVRVFGPPGRPPAGPAAGDAGPEADGARREPAGER